MADKQLTRIIAEHYDTQMFHARFNPDNQYTVQTHEA